jgi:hypothetical protein
LQPSRPSVGCSTTHTMQQCSWMKNLPVSVCRSHQAVNKKPNTALMNTLSGRYMVVLHRHRIPVFVPHPMCELQTRSIDNKLLSTLPCTSPGHDFHDGNAHMPLLLQSPLSLQQPLSLTARIFYCKFDTTALSHCFTSSSIDVAAHFFPELKRHFQAKFSVIQVPRN